jgi:hypothetical protein
MSILLIYLRRYDRDTTKYHLTAKHGIGGTGWENMPVPFLACNNTCLF